MFRLLYGLPPLVSVHTLPSFLTVHTDLHCGKTPNSVQFNDMSVRSARLVLGLLLTCTPVMSAAYYDPCEITGVGCPPAVGASSSTSSAPVAPLPPDSPWITVEPIGSDPVTQPTYPTPAPDQGTIVDPFVTAAGASSSVTATTTSTAQLAEPLHAGADLSGTGPGSMIAGVVIAAAIMVLFLSSSPKRHAHKS